MKAPFDLSNIPSNAGVYKYFDAQSKLIYVGKAKNLRNRVKSYFHTKLTSHRIKYLVSQIKRVEFTIVDTEMDALLLENNLIKNLKPKYNILLRDDKQYPYIIVTKEKFPRIFFTRNKTLKGKYYGPFASVPAMKEVLYLVNKLYPIRSCTFSLNKENIEKKKYKVCLDYHIGNCLGPCEGLQSEQEYREMINQVQSILQGKFFIVKKDLKQKMEAAANALAFEKAQSYKEKLERLERYHARSIIDSNLKGDIDVITMLSDEKYAFVNYIKVNSGIISATHSTEVKKKLETPDEDIALHLLINFRNEYKSVAKEVLTNIETDFKTTHFDIHIPTRGTRKKLLDLSLKNSYYFKNERILAKGVPLEKKYKTLAELQRKLNLKDIPLHIECFDNSNIQGSNPVAAMVCFMNGKPAKKRYRHYHIKTVDGPDDFASMFEIVKRRYSRLIKEGKKLPDLIVIDGGKGQLSSACQALNELNILDNVAIIGLAKRLEEVFFPKQSLPLYIDKRSTALKLLQQVRNEAHRFGINFHRQLRSKNAYTSELDEIKGIGKKTIAILYKHFKTIQNIKSASFEEIKGLVGQAKAVILKDSLKD